MFENIDAHLIMTVGHFFPLDSFQGSLEPLILASECAGGVIYIDHKRQNQISTKSRVRLKDFPGSPVFKTSPSSIGGEGLIPHHRAKIPQPKNQNEK